MVLYKTKPPPLKGKINDVSEVMKTKFEDNIVNILDYKSTLDKFRLHSFFLAGTWILDEVKIDDQIFLFCVEGNSRYLKGIHPMTKNEKGELEDKKVINSEGLEVLLNGIINNNQVEINDKSKHVRKMKYII